jgi:hypothetical protein
LGEGFRVRISGSARGLLISEIVTKDIVILIELGILEGLEWYPQKRHHSKPI